MEVNHRPKEPVLADGLGVDGGFDEIEIRVLGKPKQSVQQTANVLEGAEGGGGRWGFDALGRREEGGGKAISPCEGGRSAR